MLSTLMRKVIMFCCDVKCREIGDLHYTIFHIIKAYYFHLYTPTSRNIKITPFLIFYWSLSCSNTALTCRDMDRRPPRVFCDTCHLTLDVELLGVLGG